MYARLRCGSSLLQCLAFGTGEGHLWYRICVPCSKRLPGVRDAFSEAFGVKSRLLRYGICVPCSKRLPGVRDAFSEALRAQNRLLGYGRDIRYRKRPPTVRDASSKASRTADSTNCGQLPVAPDASSVRETTPARRLSDIKGG